MEKSELNFETGIKELEQIADKLEKENLNLDESVNLFEKGMELSKKCSEILENAEKRITKLIVKEDEIEETDFVSK